jgi:5-formyltetrahydrofolate cyclo-ligase
LDKKQARALGLAARGQLSPKRRRAYDRSLLLQAKEALQDAHAVGIYVSFGSEADTRALIQWCLDSGKSVAVPRTLARTLEFQEIHSMQELKPGVWGILEPSGGRVIPASAVDAMIVPLTAFDSDLHRVGYGRGYYDSVLGSVRNRIGIAYPEQQMPMIETDPWDIALDRILVAKIGGDESESL